MLKAKKLIQPVNSSSKWYLIADTNRSGEVCNRIRRTVVIDGKRTLQSYPANLYRQLEPAEVNALLTRLNATYESEAKAAASRYIFDHSYVNLKSMAAFEKQLAKNITDTSKKQNVLQMLNDYVFEYFIVLNKQPDPSRWHLLENNWGEWLLNKDLSPATLRLIVSTANRFNKFLTDKMYTEMARPRKLEPIGKLKLDKIDRDRLKNVPKKYIDESSAAKIFAAAEAANLDVLPNMRLALAFGLRISETLGLTKSKLLKNNVLVDEQGDSIDEDGSVVRRGVKTMERRVPYWNITAKEAWALIQQIEPMHPDTLIKRVNTFLEKFSHTSHDFRHTFITNAHRKHHWKDVQLAAGHTDPRTTMGYDQDDRALSDEKADLD